ncbi:MAG: hypothetical protein COV44_10325 [Deltaproteobacteria bacterium CG11_big_fil_rev_8_21_14_0_20_45_16]|nr:MAG: hypothetical protein COV44_10325 [Deltaproteobacteria bacterium CG11_big_fil_rev_8_21_14_0_20_45_16]
MKNSLSLEASAYLRQHQDNPVAWFSWGTEALEKARNEKKPIFLSIGYSSCHWCHVMERESFSDQEIAQILNEKFVSIKLDREERPDLDALYMKAVQLMTGHGGWPLNVFLTPELRPFFGGTYFPPEPMKSRPSFRQVLTEIDKAFHEQADAVKKNSDGLTHALFQSGRYFEAQPLDQATELENRSIQNLMKISDKEHGGFGSAPKFFHAENYRLLMRHYFVTKNNHCLEILEKSLKAMIFGGIYDQVGGGFHRYSTDHAWHTPHFEKMLYDNALMLDVLVEAWQLTKKDLYREVALDIIDWLKREMTSAQLGFFSSIDADSNHEEGEFYVWQYDDLKSLLEPELLQTLDIHPSGNFESRNIIYFKEDAPEDVWLKFKRLKRGLQEIRSRRVKPETDRKIQVSWNALMLSALSKASFVFQLDELKTLVGRTLDSIWSRGWTGSSLAHVIYEDGVTKMGFLEDYSYLAEAFLRHFQYVGRFEDFERAQSLSNALLEDFYDDEVGGFWMSSQNQADILLRSKDIFDGALPSPYAVAVSVMDQMHQWTTEAKYARAFEKSSVAIMGSALQQCGGFGRFVLALQESRSSLIVAVQPGELGLQAISKDYIGANKLFVWDREDQELESLSVLKSKWGPGPAYYVCHHGECQNPQELWSHQLFASPVDKAS